MTLPGSTRIRTTHGRFTCTHVGQHAVFKIIVVVVVVYLYLTSAKCTGIAAFSLWPEATALTEMVKVELHERKKMKFYNV